MVPGAAHGQPAGLHRTLGIEVVPGVPVFQPSGCHDTAGVHVVPLLVVVGELPAGEHARIVLEEVPRVADLGPADGRTAGATQPVPVTTVREPARRHRAGGVQVVPGASHLFPSGRHVAGRAQVVPGALLLLPARDHRGALVEEVETSIERGPSSDRAPVGSGPIPAPANLEPARLSRSVADEAPAVARLLPRPLAQPVGIGDARRIGDPEGAHEGRVAQQSRVGGGGQEGVLDDDPGDTFLARLAVDRVVVARGAVGVVVVGVVSRLDSSVGQPQARQFLLDGAGQGAPLGVGGVVVRRGVGVPDLGTLGHG